MAFLAKVIPWGTNCKLTKKSSVMLLLWILTESVQLKGVRSWIFSCQLKSSVTGVTDCWVKPVRPDSETPSDPVFYYHVASLTRTLPLQPSFSICFSGSTLVKVTWLQGMVLGWEKSWVPVWGKGRGEADVTWCSGWCQQRDWGLALYISGLCTL